MFAEILYRSPGPHRHRSGKTYDFRSVTNPDEAHALQAKGWSADREAAMGLKAPLPEVEPERPDQIDAPPTRAEMEAKAAEIGLAVDGRWGDTRLLAAINAALDKDGGQ